MERQETIRIYQCQKPYHKECVNPNRRQITTRWIKRSDFRTSDELCRVCFVIDLCAKANEIEEKTALTGRVRTELNCLPVENAGYKQIMIRRNAQEHKILPPVSSVGDASLAAMLGGQRTVVENFIVCISSTICLTNTLQKSAPHKAKSQQNKNVRMAKNELLDVLYNCFREYKYWRLKDLRARLQQPEQYIKEGLVTISAHLIHSGPKVGTYALSEASQKILQSTGGGIPIEDEAPEQDVDDDSFKMEQ